MKKLFLLTGIFALMSALTISAQVTIGAQEAPDPSAVLDLRSNNKLGLLLPRVELTDTLVAAPVTSPKQGLFVYNTNTSVDGKVSEGVYYYDGRRWWPTKGGDSAEPWQVTGEQGAKATINTQNIYQTGQVTIGADTLVPTAMLNVVSNNKGILIPRLTEKQRDEIISPAHGLEIFNIDENCFNYYDSIQSSWQSLCGSTNAAFTFACNKIGVNGTYVKESPLTAENYLSVTITASKKGAFSIVGATDNGYSFFYNGVITGTGTYVINLPGLGAPLNAQTDQIKISGSGSADTCYVANTVQANVASFSLDCSNITVAGQYIKGTQLTDPSKNYIMVRVTVAAAGYYYLSTPKTNGVQFEASGYFSAGDVGLSKTITLNFVAGSNPTVINDFPITINTNTLAGNATCSTTIPMILPPLTYILIGADGTYSWSNARKPALQNGASFGPNGKVRVASLTDISAGAPINNATQAISYLAQKPDLVMYFAYGFNNTSALTAELQNYVNQGGVLIYASRSDGLADCQDLISGIFPGTHAQAQTNCNWNCPSSWPNDDNCYLINNIPGDPIVYGPFGNLAGKYWAEDNGTTGTFYVTALPDNVGAVQICSAQNNWGHQNADPAWSVVWYSEKKNFFFFGDTNGASTSDTSNGGYPAYYSTSGLPLSKQYGNGDNQGSPFIHVSALELNAVAWGVKKAAVSGINPH